jgi:hypothetical protein
MTVLKRISPASAFKVGLVVYGIVGLVLGILCSLIAAAGVTFAPHSRMPFFMGRVGVFAVIVCPIIYGIIGGVGAVIGAAIYNLAAGWVGGLEVDIS